MTDSRQFVPELVATLEHLDEGRVQLRSPSPGWWRDPPPAGALIQPGDELGAIELLGVLHRLRAPEGATGVVVDRGETTLARRPVDHGAALLTLHTAALGPAALGNAAVSTRGAELAASGMEGRLVFRSPSSGRFFQRPGPERPPFIEVGQIIERGQTIGLLEVMKTFTRINYDDAKLPARAKVLKIAAADQADIGRGEVLVELEIVAE